MISAWRVQRKRWSEPKYQEPRTRRALRAGEATQGRPLMRNRKLCRDG